MRKGSDIAARLLRLAVAVLKIVASLPKDPAGKHVGGQIVRAVTGAGSNYEEARAAESRADFIHKMGVSAKETRETGYWLGLIEHSDWQIGGVPPLIQECGELNAIMGASIRTARSRLEKP